MMASLMVTCPRCDGTGDEPGAPAEIDMVPLCITCGGIGLVPKNEATAYRKDSVDDHD